MEFYFLIVPLGFLLDYLFGDPFGKFHPIVVFGNVIAKGEKAFNKGSHLLLKGGFFAVILIVVTFLLFWLVQFYVAKISPLLLIIVNTFFLFLGIAMHTLCREVKDVFKILDAEGIDAGRKQIARIVGRDTSNLSAKQIKIAALETLAENLSDGVIAPLFWFGVAGIPGLFAYKMVNTLDSMIGYKSDRYLYFGRVAAYIDDFANYIPARLTALLMLIVFPKRRVYTSIIKFSRCHSSPNSGFPESAMAGVLDCRFGGPNVYHGKIVEKPYIGITDREPQQNDLKIAIRVSYWAVILVLGFVCLVLV